MADKKSKDTTEGSGGSKRMIVVVALCVVIAGAGFVLGGRMTGAGTAAAPDGTVPEEVEPTIDVIVELEPLNVNLAGGHYLRLAVAIGLTGHAEGGGGGHGGGSEDEPPIETAPASDLVLSTFAGRDMTQLATPEGREQARSDLHAGLVGFYGDDVVSVLFTEFVMQ